MSAKFQTSHPMGLDEGLPTNSLPLLRRAQRHLLQGITTIPSQSPFRSTGPLVVALQLRCSCEETSRACRGCSLYLLSFLVVIGISFAVLTQLSAQPSLGTFGYLKQVDLPQAVSDAFFQKAWMQMLVSQSTSADPHQKQDTLRGIQIVFDCNLQSSRSSDAESFATHAIHKRKNFQQGGTHGHSFVVSSFGKHWPAATDPSMTAPPLMQVQAASAALAAKPKGLDLESGGMRCRQFSQSFGTFLRSHGW